MRLLRDIQVFPTLLPVTKTFSFASGSTGPAGSRAPHVFVKLVDSEGEVGWGEARPVPSWSYETLESVTTTIRHHLAPALLGHPIADRRGLHQRMHAVIGRGPSTGQPIAKAALDMALHDLCARAAGLPLRAFLGGSDQPASVALSYTVTAHDPAAAAEDVAAGRALGYRHFNFKAALLYPPAADPLASDSHAHAHQQSPAADAALARAIRDAAGPQDPQGPQGPQAFVWADANQGYRLHQAREAAARFQDAGVDLLEQPLPADQRHLMRQLRASCTLPLAVDESSVGPPDFLPYVAEGLVDYLVIKVTRSGGLWPTTQQLAIADAAGLPFLVSGLTESLLAKLAACQIAAAHGFAGPAALNGSQFVDDSALFPAKPTIERNGTVHLPTTPGIGIHPEESALTAFLAPS